MTAVPYWASACGREPANSKVDILADGTLDLPEDVLRELDYTVGSIHSRFGFFRTDERP